MSLKLSLVSHFPRASGSVELKASQTLKDLQEAAVKALPDVPAIPQAYVVFAAAGNDVVEFGPEVDPSTSLEKAGIASDGVLLFRSSVIDLEPQPDEGLPDIEYELIEVKEKKEAEVLDDVDFTELFTVLDKLSPEKALAQLADGAKDNLTEPTLGSCSGHYVDTNFKDVVGSKAWGEAKQSVVKAILSRDSLGEAEDVIFNAIVRWGAGKLKKKEHDDKFRETVEDLLTTVRWDQLSLSVVASKVARTNLFTDEELLSLYECAGRYTDDMERVETDNTAVFKYQKVFDVRVGPASMVWFKWDKKKKNSNIQLSNDDSTVNSTSSGYKACFGTRSVKSGKWFYGVKIKTMYNSTYGIMIGWVPKKTDFPTSSSQLLGYSSHISTGYSLDLYSGNRYVKGSTKSGGTRNIGGPGITVWTMIDFDKKEITYYAKGKKLADKTIPMTQKEEMLPAFSCYYNNSFSLDFSRPKGL